MPDITAVHPVTGKEYVLDCRISWNIMSDTAGGGFGAYKANGSFAAAGEKIKRKSWRDAVNERRINAPAGVEFVPFSIEVSGVWGPAARGFFRESIAMAHSARDIDLYHWSNQRLSDSWKSTFSVLVARERARVGMAAATQDWARRINRMRDSDQENQDAGH